MPVWASWDEMMLRSALRTWLLYGPKFGSSPEARKTITAMPVMPGPCWPPCQSPWSVCVRARYCRPWSYISRTSRGTRSPARAAGNWARAPADQPRIRAAARAIVPTRIRTDRCTDRFINPPPLPAGEPPPDFHLGLDRLASRALRVRLVARQEPALLELELHRQVHPRPVSIAHAIADDFLVPLDLLGLERRLDRLGEDRVAAVEEARVERAGERLDLLPDLLPLVLVVPVLAIFLADVLDP